MSANRNRRSIRRAVAAVAVLVLAVFASWLMLGEAPEVQRAKGVQLGQTADEVLDIMGRDNYTQFNGNPMSLTFGRLRDAQQVYSSIIMQKTGLSGLQPERDDWPVHIRFDANGHVDRIKRGSEIVE